MEEHKISFNSNEMTLCGKLSVPASAGPSACIVLCHGFGSYDDDLGGFVRLAEFLAHDGFASFRFSFTGSFPYPSRGTIQPASRWVNDALAALALVGQDARIDPARVGLLGVSVGGGIVIQAAALTPSVRAVVALAPVADGEDWLRHRWLSTRGHAAWEEFVAEVDTDHRQRVRGGAPGVVDHFNIQSPGNREAWDQLLSRFPGVLKRMSLASAWDTLRFKPLFYAHALKQPLCLVQGDADESVPLKHSELIYEKASGSKELVVLKGAPHCPWDTPHERQFQLTALRWFQKWLG